MTGRILIVDDDWDFLELMKARLAGAGFQQVRIEDDPLKAAAMIQAEEVFDIALIDITMPEMDGLQLLDLVKNNSPRTECIMVTAVNDVRVAVQLPQKRGLRLSGQTDQRRGPGLFTQADPRKKTASRDSGH